jgi:hypothetical protein
VEDSLASDFFACAADYNVVVGDFAVGGETGLVVTHVLRVRFLIIRHPHQILGRLLQARQQPEVVLDFGMAKAAFSLVRGDDN